MTTMDNEFSLTLPTVAWMSGIVPVTLPSMDIMVCARDMDSVEPLYMCFHGLSFQDKSHDSGNQSQPSPWLESERLAERLRAVHLSKQVCFHGSVPGGTLQHSRVTLRIITRRCTANTKGMLLC